MKASEQARLAGKAKPNKKEQKDIARFTFTHQQAIANYNDAVRSLSQPKESQARQDKQKQKPYESRGFAGSADTIVPSDLESESDHAKVKDDIPSEDAENRKNSATKGPEMRRWLGSVFETKAGSGAKGAKEKEEKRKKKQEQEEEGRKKKQEEKDRKKKEKKRPHWVWECEVAEEERPHPGLSGGLTGAEVIVGASVQDSTVEGASKENGANRGRVLRQRSSMASSSTAAKPSARHVSTATTIQRRSSSSIREEARKDLEANGVLDNAGQTTVADSDDSSAPLNPRPVGKKSKTKVREGRVKVPKGISFFGHEEESWC